MQNEGYDLEAVAYHEAGHCVAAFLKRIPITKITIRREKLKAGQIEYATIIDECGAGAFLKENLERWIALYVGGICAVQILRTLCYREAMENEEYRNSVAWDFCTALVLSAHFNSWPMPDCDAFLKTYCQDTGDSHLTLLSDNAKYKGILDTIHEIRRATKTLLSESCNWTAVAAVAKTLLIHDEIDDPDVITGVIQQALSTK